VRLGDDTPLRSIVRRAEYLEGIRDGKRRRDELSRVVDKSESTVYKQLRDLEESGVVERASEGYRLTDLGHTVCLKLEQATRAIEFSDLFEAVDAPPEVLAKGEFHPADDKAPDEPVSKMEEDAEGADEVRGLAPVVLDRYIENTHRLVTEAGVDAEIVVEDSVMRYIEEKRSRYFDESPKDSTSVHVTDESLPYGLVLVDETLAGVVVYGEKGSTLGYARFESAEAYDWFEGVYEEHREKAETVELDS